MGQGAMLAFSVGSTLMSAKMQKDAYEMEAQQNEENAELAKIEMEQQENARRDQLLNVLSSLSSDEGSRGLAIGSGGTAQALRSSEKRMADADLSSIRLMGLSKRRQFQLGAKQSQIAGRGSILSGATSAGTTYRRYKINKGDWKIT
ncbi:MAG: hypothetical protein CBC24_09215 [Candidatus Pelagibacter sp. TMED64]|nr:MAG: hypothetical protein CBC24_09215 [Candidatus Pelagibacter sp. TMED64]|tara:strand:+ start:415 stop:855 length:441 start_codon:yes stop_codon:yes gene_type:complete